MFYIALYITGTAEITPIGTLTMTTVAEITMTTMLEIAMTTDHLVTTMTSTGSTGPTMTTTGPHPGIKTDPKVEMIDLHPGKIDPQAGSIL